MVPSSRPGVLVRKVLLLNFDLKLLVAEDSKPRVLFYAEVVDKHNIDVLYDRETAAHFGIEEFAKSKAPRHSGRA